MSIDKQTKLDSFLEWASSNGAKICKGITFKINEKNSQLFAESNDLISDSNVPLFEIPERITINPTLAEQYFGSNICGKSDRNPISKLLLAKLKFDNDNETILKLVKDSNESVNGNEFFQKYLDLLPTGKEIGSPLFWDGNERALLQGTDAFLSIDKRLFEILEEWFEVVSKLEGLKDLKKDLEFYEVFKNGKPEHFAGYINQTVGNVSWTGFPAYLWANAIFTSRAFPYILQNESSDGKTVNDINEGVLLPVFDLLNHQGESKVKWSFKNEFYSFNTEYEVKPNMEIFNSYGLKSNEVLLFNYGFVLPRNEEDYITLAFRIPEDQLLKAKKFGVKGFIGTDLVFNLNGDKVDEMLIKLFQFLVKTEDEDGVTLRNSLEGLKQLGNIVQSKIDTIKNAKVPEGIQVESTIISVTKIYRTLQRSYLQKLLEEILKTEKKLIKDNKPESFKTFFKNDQTFANSLLLTFGIDGYDKLIQSEDDLNHALNLWILRVANKNQYRDNASLPSWIQKKFEKVSKTIKITESDVKETLPVYRALFPTLSNMIPEVFNIGDWSIKNFIIAEQLKDDVVFIRKASNEAYFINTSKI